MCRPRPSSPPTSTPRSRRSRPSSIRSSRPSWTRPWRPAESATERNHPGPPRCEGGEGARARPGGQRSYFFGAQGFLAAQGLADLVAGFFAAQIDLLRNGGDGGPGREEGRDRDCGDGLAHLKITSFQDVGSASGGEPASRVVYSWPTATLWNSEQWFRVLAATLPCRVSSRRPRWASVSGAPSSSSRRGPARVGNSAP